MNAAPHTEAVKTRRRRGFTLIELLVVISIIAALMALILPAVQSARIAMRNLECLDNLKNLGIAMENFQSGSGRKGDFPYFHNNDIPPIGGGRLNDNWAFRMLAFVDAGAYYKRIIKNEVSQNPWDLHFKVLTCPSDESSFKVKGGLSYVANVGVIETSLWNATETLAGNGFTSAGSFLHDPDLYDWDADSTVTPAEKVFSRSVGVLHRPFGPGRRMSKSLLKDGHANTIVLSENLQAQKWYSGHTGNIGFGLRFDTNGTTPFLPATLNGVNVATGGPYQGDILPDSFPNSNCTVEGACPRPSSNHVGGINVLFADNRADSIRETINPAIYVRMMTSAGTNYGEFVLDDD